MTIFSKGKVNVKFKFPTIAVGSNAYCNKPKYIIIALAPVVFLGIGSLVCLLMLPYKLLFAIMMTLNFAAASGDYILTYYALKQDKNTYFVDKAEKTLVYLQENWPNKFQHIEYKKYNTLLYKIGLKINHIKWQGLIYKHDNIAAN